MKRANAEKYRLKLSFPHIVKNQSTETGNQAVKCNIALKCYRDERAFNQDSINKTRGFKIPNTERNSQAKQSDMAYLLGRQVLQRLWCCQAEWLYWNRGKEQTLLAWEDGVPAWGCS